MKFKKIIPVLMIMSLTIAMISGCSTGSSASHSTKTDTTTSATKGK